MPIFQVGSTTPLQVPLTTGFVRSFQHVRLNIAGLDFTGGFHSIKYSRDRKRELVRSNHQDPVGKTVGENEYQCSAVFLFDWYMNMLQTIQNQLGPGYGDVQFAIQVAYQATGLTTYTDQIIGCTFDKTTADNAKGTGALTREIEFNPLKILFNGIDDCAVALVAPQQ